MASGASLHDFTVDFFARVWDSQDAAAIDAAVDDCVAEDCATVGLAADPGAARAGFKQFRQIFLSSFDSTRVVVHETVEDGDRVAMRATLYARRGDQEYAVGGSGVAVVRNGQLVSAHNQWDFLGLLVQLGAVSPTILMETLQAR